MLLTKKSYLANKWKNQSKTFGVKPYRLDPGLTIVGAKNGRKKPK